MKFFLNFSFLLNPPIILLALICLILVFPKKAIACPDIHGITDLNCDRQLVIVCFGDSITFGRGDSTRLGYPGRLKLLLPDATIYNLGVPGENTYSGKLRAAQQLPLYANADYIIILQGVNDYWVPNRSAIGTRNNLLEMKALGDVLGKATIIANLTQVRRTFQIPWVVAINNEILPFAGVDFFSLGAEILSSDNLHPNGVGYQLMAERVRDFLLAISTINKPPDSDGDGIYDFAEPFFGTNPNNPDTDGDGVLDGDEVFIYKTNPTKIDTDGDGISDFDEIFILNTNPLDPKPSTPSIKKVQVVSLE